MESEFSEIVNGIVGEVELSGEEEDRAMSRTRLSNTANRLHGRSQVPEKLVGFRPGNSKCGIWSSAYERIKKEIAHGCIFGICGIRGGGKSQLGSCLIGHTVYNLSKHGEYWKAQDIFLRIRQAMKDKGDSELRVINLFVEPFLLVIDAYEVRSDSDFENRMMDHIVDKRYDDMKSTIIISNDNVDNFHKALGASTVDRIAETGGIIELKNKSFRRK